MKNSLMFPARKSQTLSIFYVFAYDVGSFFL